MNQTVEEAKAFLAERGFRNVVIEPTKSSLRLISWRCEIKDGIATSPVGLGHFGETPLSAAKNVLGNNPLTLEAWANHPRNKEKKEKKN